MTTASFNHIDTTSFEGKPWAKVDGPGNNFKQKDHTRDVHNLRCREAEFTTDNSGFAVLKYPAKERLFTDDKAVIGGYYEEVENMLRDKLHGIKKVVIFDHTIRRRKKDSPRQPVQQVHVDQTPGAAEARVRRHLPAEEAEELVQGRYQIINVWRPIENPASDHPLAVVDWRSTSPDDFIATDLMYPKRADSLDLDDRGKEVLPDANSYTSTAGYEVRGETMAVAPNEKHKFYYQKDMTPDEVLLLKCFDSWGEGMPNGKTGIAVRTPHTAFEDPSTPADAPGRQSIETAHYERVANSIGTSATQIAESTPYHTSLMTLPPIPRAQEEIEMFEQVSKDKIRRKYTHEDKHKHKEAAKQARKRGQGTSFPPTAYGSGQNLSGKSRRISSRPKQTTPTTSGYLSLGLPACSASKCAKPYPSDEGNYSLTDTELGQMVDCNVAREVQGPAVRTFDHVRLNQIPSGYRPHESEAAHELEIDRLMTLHLQRNCVFSASSNTLERLLAADDFTAIRPNNLIAPAMRASCEFILGIQHEQSELWTKTEELEARIADMRRKSKAASCTSLAALEKMLGITIALSFELLLEEGSFRDMYEKKHRCREFDLDSVFAEMRKRVGVVIAEYDWKMERLQEALAK